MTNDIYNTLRDREFDSQVRADSEAAEGQQRASCAFVDGAAKGYASEGDAPAVVRGICAFVRGPFAYAQDAFRVANTAILQAINDPTPANRDEANRAKEHAIDVLLSPYYLGRGRFDSAWFLADWRKIASPSIEAVATFGRVVGTYTGTKLAVEVSQELQAARERGASEDELVGIRQRGFLDALRASRWVHRT